MPWRPQVGMPRHLVHNTLCILAKPQFPQLNVLVNSEYHAMITDFGSARRLENETIDKQTRKDENKRQPPPRLDPTTDLENTQPQALFCITTNTITITGNCYTLRWAAPELLKDEPPCLGSDVWALGWIAYEVCFAKPEL